MSAAGNTSSHLAVGLTLYQEVHCNHARQGQHSMYQQQTLALHAFPVVAATIVNRISIVLQQQHLTRTQELKLSDVCRCTHTDPVTAATKSSACNLCQDTAAMLLDRSSRDCWRVPRRVAAKRGHVSCFIHCDSRFIHCEHQLNRAAQSFGTVM